MPQRSEFQDYFLENSGTQAPIYMDNRPYLPGNEINFTVFLQWKINIILRTAVFGVCMNLPAALSLKFPQRPLYWVIELALVCLSSRVRNHCSSLFHENLKVPNSK